MRGRRLYVWVVALLMPQRSSCCCGCSCGAHREHGLRCRVLLSAMTHQPPEDLGTAGALLVIAGVLVVVVIIAVVLAMVS
jgi:hypothetical protein